ncbi:dockerin type I domain-containing protein [Acholeplasma sp. OttesenSCG-928-E16]|nr:dockerin type I domain-containing protein [Acholeplasma sp. OttesenSCG-928-E16]
MNMLNNKRVSIFKKGPQNILKKIIVMTTLVFVMLFVALYGNKLSAAMEEIGQGPNTQYLTDLQTFNVSMVSSDSQLSELEYKVSSVAGMKVLADLVNKGVSFSGKTIYMTNNINFSSVSRNYTYMIGRFVNNVNYAFKGTFNGQNYTVQNYVLLNNTIQQGTGLFARIENAKILNLSLSGSITYNGSVSGAQYVGGPVGYANGSIISNVYNYASVRGSTIGVTNIGGIAGAAVNTSIISCGNHGAIYGSTYGSGGIVGDFLGGKLNIINCYNRGIIDVMGTYMSGASGGIIGCMHGGYANVYIKNVFNMAGSSSSTYIWPIGIVMLYNSLYPKLDMIYSVSPSIMETIRDYGSNKPSGSIYSSVAYTAPNTPDAVGNTFNGYIQKLRNANLFKDVSATLITSDYTGKLNNNLSKLAAENSEIEQYLIPWKTVGNISILDPSVKNADTISVKVQSGTTNVFQNNNQFVSEKDVSLGIGFTITNKAPGYITRYSYKVNDKPESALQSSTSFNVFEAGTIKVFGYYYNNSTYEKVKIALYEFSIYDSHDKSLTTISNSEELLAFAVRVNSGDSFKGKTVVLTKDITLSNAVNNMISIGTSLNRFEGTFDGQGFTIHGLNKNVSDSTGGLFGYIRNATVGNFTLRGSVRSTTGNVGGAINVSQGNSIIHNIFNYASVNGGSYNVAGIVANLGAGGVVISCANYGNINGPSWGNAGIVGEHGGVILNSYNRGVVPNNSVSGGIFGVNHALAATVRNTFNTSNGSIGLLMFRYVPTSKLNDIYAVSTIPNIQAIREYSPSSPNGIYTEYGYSVANYTNYKRLWISQGYLTREAVWTDAYAKQIDTVYTMNDTVLSLILEYPEYKEYFRYWYQNSSIDSGYPSFYKAATAGIAPIRPGTKIPSPTLTPSFECEYELFNGIYYLASDSFDVTVTLTNDTLLKRFEYSLTGTGNWTTVSSDGKIKLTGIQNERVLNTLYVRTVSIINTYSQPSTIKYIKDVSGPNAPQLSISTIEPGKQPSNQYFYNYDVRVSFTHDINLDGTNGVGISYYEYKINNQSLWQRANASTGIVGDFSEEGDYTVYIRGVDKLGNIGNEVNEISFKIDKTPPSAPIIERDYLGLWAKEKATLTFINDEENVTYEYKISVGNYTIINWTKITGNTLVFDDEGMYVIHVRAISQTGLVSDIKTENLRVDAGAPSISVTGNPTEWTNYIKLTANAYDGDLGIGGVIYGWSEGYSEIDALNANINWNNQDYIEVSRNNFYYVAWAKDGLDNINYEVVHITRYDSVRPTSPEMKVQTLFISQDGILWIHFMETSNYFLEYKENKSSLVGKQLIEFDPLEIPSDHTGSNIYYYRWVDVSVWTKGLTRVQMYHGKDNSIGQVGIDYSSYMIGSSSWIRIDYEGDDPIYFYLEDSAGLLSGEMDIYGQTVDNSGVTSEENLSYMRIVSARMDNQKPNSPHVEILNYYLKENDLYITNENVRIVAYDSKDPLLFPADIHSGIDRIEYKIGENGTFKTYNGAIIIGSDLESDIVEVYFRQIDKVDLISDEVLILIMIDKDLPKIDGNLESSADLNSVHGYLSVEPITFSGIAKDDSSGLQKIEFSYDNYNWNNVSFDDAGIFSFLIDVPGKHQIFFRIYDKAGNVFFLEDPLEVLYSDDNPEFSISLNEAWVSSTTKQVTFTSIYQDFPITHYYLSQDPTRPTSSNDQFVELNEEIFYLDLASGIYYIYAMNSLGTIGTVNSFEVDKIDTTAPIIENAIQEDYLVWSNGAKKVTIEAIDNESGVKGFYITNNINDIPTKDSAFKLEIYIDLSGTYYLYAIDHANNISDKYTIIESYIDIEAPIVSNVRIGEGYLTVSLIDEANGSGIKGYYVSNSLIINLGFINSVSDNLLDVEIYGVGNVYVWAVDNALNISLLPTQVTVPSNDTINPTIDNITVDNTNWVKGTRSVTMTFSDNSRLYGYKVTNANILPLDDEWIMGQTITGKQTTTITEQLTNGVYFLWVRDLSGNTAVSNSFTVSKVDTELPNVSISFSPVTGIYAKEVLITIIASDNESGLATISYKFNNEEWSSINTYKASIEDEEVIIQVSDAVGNIYQIVQKIDWIDTSAPIIEIQIENEEDYVNVNKNVFFTLSDLKSGLYGYLINQNNSNIPSQEDYLEINDTTISFSIDYPNGTYYIWVIDNCGNYDLREFVIKNIDKNSPTFEVNGNPTTYLKEVTLSVENIDYSISGIHPEGSISFDNGNTWSNANTIYIDSNQTLTVKVRNLAGNIKTVEVEITKVDGIAPIIDILIPDSSIWTNTDKLVSIIINDNQNGSGVKGYYLSNNPSATPNEEDFIDYLEPLDGYYQEGTYYMFAIDNSGNISERYTFTIDKIDRQKPILTINHDGSANFILEIEVIDQGNSGIKGVYFSNSVDINNIDLNSMNFVDYFGITEIDVLEVGTWYFIAIDNAQNLSDIVFIKLYGNIVERIRGLITDIGHVTLDSEADINIAEQALLDYILAVGNETDAYLNVGQIFIDTLYEAKAIYQEKLRIFNKIYDGQAHNLDQIIDPSDDDLYYGYSYYLSEENAIKYSDADSSFGAILSSGIKLINDFDSSDIALLEDIFENALREMKNVPMRYTISFNSNGGTYIKYITGDAGSDISSLDIKVPEKDFHAFLYWGIKDEQDQLNKYEFSVIPSKNITLEAVWLLIPQGLTGRYNNTLASISLPLGWSWVNEELLFDELGLTTFEAYYDSIIYEINVNVLLGIIESIEVIGINTIYDGNEHSLSITNGVNLNDIIEYKIGSNGQWLSSNPVFVDVISEFVYIRITRTNYEIFVSEPVLVIINKADIPLDHFTINNIEAVYDKDLTRYIEVIIDSNYDYEVMYRDQINASWDYSNLGRTNATESLTDGKYLVYVRIINNSNPNYNNTLDVYGTIKIDRAIPNITPVLDEVNTFTSTANLPLISYLEKDIPGTITWDSYQIPSTGGTYSFNFTFTPSDNYNYKNKTGSIDIEIKDVIQDGILVIVDEDIKTIYTSTKLDSIKDYLTVLITYNDQTRGEVPLSKDEYTLYVDNFSASDNVLVTVTQNDTFFQATFYIDILAVNQTGIEVEVNIVSNIYTSTNLESIKDEIVVKKVFNDQSKVEVSKEEYSLNVEDFNAEENKIVTVRENESGYEATFRITVIKVEPVSIEAKIRENSGVIYTTTTNEGLKEKIEVKVNYNDKNQKEIEEDEFSISGTWSVAGSNHIIIIRLIENNNITTTLENISSVEPKMIHLEVVDDIIKKEYYAFDGIELEGLKLLVHFDDGLNMEVRHEDIEIIYQTETNDTFRYQENEVTLSYGGLTIKIEDIIVNKAMSTVNASVKSYSILLGANNLPEIMLEDGSTEGIIEWASYDLSTLDSGEYSFDYLFTPTDLLNYETYVGSLLISILEIIPESLKVTYIGEKEIPITTNINELKEFITGVITYNDSTTIEANIDDLELSSEEWKDGDVTIRVSLVGLNDVYDTFEIFIYSKPQILTVIDENKTFKIIDNDQNPIDRQDYKYDESKEVYLTGLALGDTLDLLLKQFDASLSDLRVYAKTGGALIEENQYETKTLATGMIVQLVSGTEILDSITLVVRGDINGDGRVNVTDRNQINNYINKIIQLTGASLLAADNNADRRVNVTDRNRINSYINKQIDLYDGLSLKEVK